MENIESRKDAANKFLDRVHLFKDATIESVKTLVPGFTDDLYLLVVWLARLCNHEMYKDIFCVPEEIVAGLTGVAYVTSDDKKNFKHRYLQANEFDFSENSLADTQKLVGKILSHPDRASGGGSSHDRNDRPCFKRPNTWFSGTWEIGENVRNCGQKYRFMKPKDVQLLLVHANNERGRAIASIYLAIANAAINLADRISNGEAVIAEAAQVVSEDPEVLKYKMCIKIAEQLHQRIPLAPTGRNNRMNKFDKDMMNMVETNLDAQRRTIINVTTTDMLKAERERNESEIELIKEKRALMELEAREGGRLNAYENKRRRLDNPTNRLFFRR